MKRITMTYKSILKSLLKSIIKSCKKYNVDFDDILKELKGEENVR